MEEDNSDLCGARPQKSSWRKKEAASLFEAGNLALHGAGLFAMMEEGGLGASPGAAVLTPGERMDGESARASSAAEALDHELGVGVPPPVLKGAEMQHTLLRGAHGY